MEEITKKEAVRKGHRKQQGIKIENNDQKVKGKRKDKR